MSIANLPASASVIASSASAAGKSYRLGRIFAGDGRTVILPVDHGTMLGRVAGLEAPVAGRVTPGVEDPSAADFDSDAVRSGDGRGAARRVVAAPRRATPSPAPSRS